MTSAEAEAYFRQSGVVIIPAGSTEQHGPEGLIGTDAICAAVIAEAAAEQAGWLVGPTLDLGVAPFNMAFSGTITVRPSVLTMVAVDYLRSLACHGATHILFLNGHGGNIAPLRAAIHEMQTEHAFSGTDRPLPACRVRSWWELPTCDALRRDYFGDREGMHGTPSEFSIVMAARPGSRQRMTGSAGPVLSAEYLRNHGGDAHADAGRHRAGFPDGLVGSDPGLARAELGKCLIEAAAADLIREIESFREA
ncbi:MAG: creatininase family protein [Rhodospirillales bacterium]